MKKIKACYRLSKLFTPLNPIRHFCSKIILFNSLIFYLPCYLNAQEQNTGDIDLSKISFSIHLSGRAFFESSDTTIADDSIPHLRFTQKILPEFTNRLPLEIAGKSLYLKFNIYNGSDSVCQSYFFPGFYFTSMKILKSNNNAIQKGLSEISKNEADSNGAAGFALLTLQPKENAVFFVRLYPLKSDIGFLSPQIINKAFISYFKRNLSDRPINRVSYMVSGILLIMIFYSLTIYFQNAKKEFLYYSGYAFFTGILFFFKSCLHNYSISINYYFEGYFDFILQSGGFLFYIGFIREFLHTAKEHPILEKNFRASQWLTIALMAAFSFAYFFTDSFILPGIIENATKLLLIVLSIFFIIYGLRKKETLINYLATGQSMLILFSIISFVMFFTPMAIRETKIHEGTVLNEPMLYYETGIVLELAFFLLALAYKNKNDIAERSKESEHLKLDNEKKEFEKQIAVIEAKTNERRRISADMHDELGSGVTAIRLMSEIVKSKMKNQALPEIEKISCSANELHDKMNAFIWTMLSSNDSAESLVTYIRAYAVEFFESTPINCHVNMPAFIPAAEINGEKRRNMFLSVKEALNNALKHSQAYNININISINKNLTIEICDDGIGINMEELRKSGNGINNIRKRIESIGGDFIIQNHNGTTMVFTLKL